jgi:gamma-glutamylcysteine synthetase
MTITHSNRLRLVDARTMPIGEIAALPADHLVLLQEDAEAALAAAKTTAEWIAAAIALRYTDRAQAVRRAESKDTGTVRFDDGNVTVIAELPKRVDWDQKTLANVVERIRAAGDDPAEYIDLAYKVPERKFTAWPERIRAAFAPARTVRAGKATFLLTLKPDR